MDEMSPMCPHQVKARSSSKILHDYERQGIHMRVSGLCMFLAEGSKLAYRSTA